MSIRPEMPMDALTQVLHVLRLQPRMFYRLELAASWGMGLSVGNGASFHVMERGGCWLKMPDGEILALNTGDLVVISHTDDYALLSDQDAQALPLASVLKQRDAQGVVRMSNGDGDIARLICGSFQPEYEATYPLFSLLPRLIHIRGEEGRSLDWLTTSLYFISDEATAARPAKDTVISRLMDILFIMVVRHWIDERSPETGGWLGALYHPYIGLVLSALHAQPEQAWSVETMANTAGLSRSAFAAQFTVLVGEPPMRYLTRWRMQLAVMWLTSDSKLSIEEIAWRVGYDSPYAFSKAFKRLLGVAPRAYREGARKVQY
jgi:AraC-like DNA-binding protein